MPNVNPPAAPPNAASRRERVVVLLSGGLDSSTLLAEVAAPGDREIFALSFRYGQRHEIELAFARHQAARFGVSDHRIVDLSHLGELVAPATALVANSALEVPKLSGIEDSTSDPGVGDGPRGETDIPVTYVPARNTLFLSYALAWSEVLGARAIFVGVNAVDYSGYPDCRPAFVDAFERLANLATKVGVEQQESGASTPAIRIEAPLLGLRKHEIVARGLRLGVDYAQTLSCYSPTLSECSVAVQSAASELVSNASTTMSAGKRQPSRGPEHRPSAAEVDTTADALNSHGSGDSQALRSSSVVLACGACDSCRLRLQGFARAGTVDPARYIS